MEEKEVEELLKLLQDSDVEIKSSEFENIVHNDNIRLFISVFNLKPGNTPVPAKLIYHVYKMWSDPAKRLSQTAFYNRMTYFFAKSVKKSNHCYDLNQNSLELSDKAFSYKKSFNKKIKSPYYRKHIEAFFSKYDIKSGPYWIESHVLYYLYDKWTYHNKSKNPLGRDSFLDLLKLYFKYGYSTKGGMWFSLDKSIRKHFVDGSHLSMLRKAYNKEYSRKKRNENKKKKQI